MRFVEADGGDLVTVARQADQILASLPTDPVAYGRLPEAALLQLNRLAAHARQVSTILGAVIAGEIAHRSAPSLGSSGLAQRTGFRTAEEFVKSSTGSIGVDARNAVRLGQLMRESATGGRVDPVTGAIDAPTEPWLAPVAKALAAQQMSIAAADSIRSGLGRPSSSIDTATLSGAAAQLCFESQSLDPDRVYRRARQLRDELDAAGVAAREAERRQQRSLRLTTLPSGMGRLVWSIDPETLMSVKDVYDRLTSPKLGGVRFASGNSAATAERIVADTRTADQLASDGFAELLRLGASHDPNIMVGSGAPIVTVVTTANTVTHRDGSGFFEGQPDAVDIHTIERLTCTGATRHVTVDTTGQPLNLGRDQRLFSRRQKLVLAVRDGGCLMPGCDRPPSWCEAHHIRFWARDHGETNVVDGVLLCRHHHLLLHNNAWEIRRDAGVYSLIPPPGLGDGKPIRLQSKSPLIRRHYPVPGDDRT